MAAEPNRLSVQEYLRLERLAETKNEYLDGQMVAMTGATLRHNGIVTNLARELSGQLYDRPCEVYPNDLRVRIPSANVYVYPDATVVCGEPRLEDSFFDTLLNPTLIVEVLSPSTVSYDRGKKLRWYQSLDSLSEILLISQDAPVIEQHVRQGDDWISRTAEGLEAVLPLPSIQAELALAEVYHKVSFG
jgi:Uma2 family endonuclease